MNKSTPDFSVIDQKTFVDIPNSRPEFEIALERVGVTNRPLSLLLEDPFLESPVSLPCRLTVFASLKASQRGLHMSRIEEAIDELRGAALSPQQFVVSLAKLVQTTQSQDRCEISLEADYEHRVSKNPSGRSSVELLTLRAQAEVFRDQTTVTSGITVPFINACPCTQRWGMRQFYSTLREKGYEPSEAEEITRCAPLQAHTNRGKATVTVSDPAIRSKPLYDILDRSVPIIRELLKGQDEHAVVSHAHQCGQFCEDNIRAILMELHSSLANKIASTATISVEVDVDESVHFHNLTALWRGNLDALQHLIGK
jgi:GTP cyclohydrolase-4